VRSAFSSIGGKVFPRFSARRRMPLQAVGLKQNRCGTSLLGSKMSDKKDTPASLWNSEVLSVQDSPREIIPEFCHRPDDATKVPSS